MKEFKPRYSFASVMFLLLIGAGWFVMAGGLYVILVGTLNHAPSEVRMIEIGAGGGVTFAGVVLTVLGSLGGAILDGSNNTAEMVHLMKGRAVARTANKSGA